MSIEISYAAARLEVFFSGARDHFCYSSYDSGCNLAGEEANYVTKN